MAEWIKWGLGFVIPLLLLHAVWATRTLLKLDQKVFGTDGKNGLNGDLKQLEATVYGDPGEHSLEQRARHGAIDHLSGSLVKQEMDLRTLEKTVARLGGAHDVAEALAAALKTERKR